MNLGFVVLGSIDVNFVEIKFQFEWRYWMRLHVTSIWIGLDLYWIEFKYIERNLKWIDLNSNSTKFNWRIGLRFNLISNSFFFSKKMQIGGENIEFFCSWIRCWDFKKKKQHRSNPHNSYEHATKTFSQIPCGQGHQY